MGLTWFGRCRSRLLRTRTGERIPPRHEPCCRSPPVDCSSIDETPHQGKGKATLLRRSKPRLIIQPIYSSAARYCVGGMPSNEQHVKHRWNLQIRTISNSGTCFSIENDGSIIHVTILLNTDTEHPGRKLHRSIFQSLIVRVASSRCIYFIYNTRYTIIKSQKPSETQVSLCLIHTCKQKFGGV